LEERKKKKRSLQARKEGEKVLIASRTPMKHLRVFLLYDRKKKGEGGIRGDRILETFPL